VEHDGGAGPSRVAVASGVDVGEGGAEGQSLERVNKGKQRASEGGDGEES
jgi:hypothetical protein